MNLFEQDGFDVKISPLVSQLIPFKRIIDADPDPDKAFATQVLTFIFFYSDIKSDYQAIMDTYLRAETICLDMGMPDDFSYMDEEIQDAIKLYEERSLTIIRKALSELQFSYNKLSNFLKNLDLNEKDDKQKYVTTPTSYAQSLKAMTPITKDIMALEKQMRELDVEESASRGSQTRSMMD